MLNFRVVNLNILYLNKEQLYICNVKKFILILLFPLFVFSQSSKEVLDHELFATFYNVENLFDTIDDKLSEQTKQRIDTILSECEDDNNENDDDNQRELEVCLALNFDLHPKENYEESYSYD